MAYPSDSHRLLVDHIADKWNVHILNALSSLDGRGGFTEIKKQIDGITQKTFAQQLRRLERNGILERVVLNKTPVRVEYVMTKLGRSLEAPYKALTEWALSHLSEVNAAQNSFDGRKDPAKEIPDSTDESSEEEES